MIHFCVKGAAINESKFSYMKTKICVLKKKIVHIMIYVPTQAKINGKYIFNKI